MVNGKRARALDIYRMLLLLNRRLEYIMDVEFRKDGLTMKQWWVLASIDSLPEGPPSLGEVAGLLCTSHQNVRQISDQLERKGFLSVERDTSDRRVLRLRTTEKNREYWDSRAEYHTQRVMELFDGMDDDEILAFHGLLERFMERVTEAHEAARSS